MVSLTHQLAVQGLLAEKDYACTVAPISEDDTLSSQGGFSTSPLPSDLPSATASSTGAPGAAYTLMPHQRLSLDETSIRLVLMDNEGGVRWYYNLPFEGYADMGAEYWGDGLFLWGGVSGSAAGEGVPRLISVSHEEVYRASYPSSQDLEYHHMTEVQHDGSVVTLVYAEASDGQQDCYGFEVHQLDVESDSLLWSWSLQDAVDEGTLTRGDANWAGIMVEESGSETMIISLCEGFAVAGVDMSSGQVAWILAEDGDLTLNEEGDYPSCQHGLDIDGQRILLYDNGAQPTSRAVEYSIDASSGKAKETWSWTEDGWRELAWGDVDYLGEDRVVITRGHVGYGGGEGPSQVVEVDRSDDSVVWRLSFTEDSDAIYSADRIDGCELFADSSRCPALKQRLDDLAAYF